MLNEKQNPKSSELGTPDQKKNNPTQNTRTAAGSEIRQIPVEKVPDILRAYAEGIEEYLRTIFPGTIRTMVNHDLTGTFCIWFNLVFDGPHGKTWCGTDRLLVMEIGAAGVAMADIEHYRDRAKWEDRYGSASSAPCPAPEPLRLDYADPNLLQHIGDVIRGYFQG